MKVLSVRQARAKNRIGGRVTRHIGGLPAPRSGDPFDIQAERERLQAEKGMRFRDSAEFYKDIASDGDMVAGDRIRARSRLDALLGYDAAPPVGQGDRALILAAVSAIQSSLTAEKLSTISGDLSKRVIHNARKKESEESQGVTSEDD